MIVYFGKTFRSSLAGTLIKSITCEKCQAVYNYQMVRRGEGASSAPYYIGQRRAARKCEELARKSLEKRLRKGIDPVPCHDCGWFQKNMVAELQSRKLRGLLWTGWTVLILGIIICFISASAGTGNFSRHIQPGDLQFLTAAAIITFVIVVTAFGVRWLAQRAGNPNAAFPQHPDPIPGMPRAFKPGAMNVVTLADDIKPSLQHDTALQYERRPPLVSGGGWVTVQLLNIRYPAICCACLQPTEEMHRYSLASDTDKIPVRICKPCRKASSRRVWGTTAAFVVLGALSGGGLAFFHLPANSDSVSMIIGTAVVGTIFAGLFGYLAIAQFLHAVRFSQFSPIHYTIRLRFRNRQYTTPFADENQMTS